MTRIAAIVLLLAAAYVLLVVREVRVWVAEPDELSTAWGHRVG